MRILERAVMRRFVRELAVYAGLFETIALAFLMTRSLGKADGWPSWVETQHELVTGLKALELAITLAAPIAMIRTLVMLSESGPLLAAGAAGHGAPGFRRILALAAVSTMLATTLARISADVWSRVSERAPTRRLWSEADQHVLCLGFDDREHVARDLIVFRTDDLQLLRVAELRRSPGAGRWTSAGRESVPAPPRRRRSPMFDLEGGARWLAACNRALFGAALLVLLGYVTLALPLARAGLAFAVYLVAAASFGCGGLWVQLLLFGGRPAGWILQLAIVGVWTALVVVLDRSLCRRGLRFG